ncbi:hypothetical protein [Mycoplasma phocoenae]|uniref:Uncharacterized protein n=1 Tax=Mycoplasma phocoenae TaxID=754517 RepID=A0A858U6G5_9MOLU|nr:hypothetical protein [Mycoplasma phocoenae]QJG66855.1 hypothetical protein HGG69_00745 [Mycoplasma phocoenae]
MNTLHFVQFNISPMLKTLVNFPSNFDLNCKAMNNSSINTIQSTIATLCNCQ